MSVQAQQTKKIQNSPNLNMNATNAILHAPNNAGGNIPPNIGAILHSTLNNHNVAANNANSGAGILQLNNPQPGSQGAVPIVQSGAPTAMVQGMPGTTTVVVTSGSQASTPTQSITPPGNNAPKYGTLIPNRIFVGGISANTTEVELAQLFSAYGTVKATKIISDRAGVSKGYGFVTFESEEEAKRLQREADNIVLRERKLNIAPAIKKQPFSRPLEGTPGSPPVPGALPAAAAPSQFYFPTAGATATPFPFQNGGVTYYNPSATDPSVYPAGPTLYAGQPTASAQSAAAAAAYPMMYPPTMYMPQQYAAYSHIPYNVHENSSYPMTAAPYTDPCSYNDSPAGAPPSHGTMSSQHGSSSTTTATSTSTLPQMHHHHHCAGYAGAPLYAVGSPALMPTQGLWYHPANIVNASPPQHQAQILAAVDGLYININALPFGLSPESVNCSTTDLGDNGFPLSSSIQEMHFPATPGTNYEPVNKNNNGSELNNSISSGNHTPQAPITINSNIFPARRPNKRNFQLKKNIGLNGNNNNTVNSVASLNSVSIDNNQNENGMNCLNSKNQLQIQKQRNNNLKINNSEIGGGDSIDIGGQHKLDDRMKQMKV